MTPRKIHFVEAEADAEGFFAEAFADHETGFSESLAGVPTDCEVLSVFISEPVDSVFLDAHPALRFIATRSTGCDHIDMVACQERGVIVANVGRYGENTVAEHTFALILAITRQLRESDAAAHSGSFRREALRGFDLRGRTLGVAGVGRVGLHVIRIASGFGMRVLAFDHNPHPFIHEILDFQYVTLDELLASSHILTLHLPLNPATRHIINRDTLAKCRPGMILINTARGGLVDTAAMIEALDSGHLIGAGLDVLEDERVFQGGATSVMGEKIAERVRQAAGGGHDPSATRVAEFSRLVNHSHLVKRSDVVLTPHVAFNSEEADACLRETTIENIRCYLEGKPVASTCS